MSGAFRYANPALIRWGEGSVAQISADLDRLGATRCAVVSTRSVVASPAVMGPLRDALGGLWADGAIAVIGQHAPVGDIEAAVVALRKAAPDAIVSAGGGSPIDAAKLVALELGRERGGPRLVHVAVPTTLSVAELGASAGSTDESGNKVGRRDQSLLPDAALYDGALAVHTPLQLWLSTGIRALDHAVEGFLSPGDHPHPDVLAVAAATRLFDCLPRTRARPDDPSLRTEGQLAAWFSFTLPGPSAAGLSHVLGKQIGARHAIPHGVTSCILLPHVIRYRAAAEGERIGELARRTGLAADAAGLAAAVEELIAELGLPNRLRGFDLTDRDLEVAAAGAGGDHQVAALVDVYRAAW